MVALAPESGPWWVAVSIVGPPTRVRVAWVDPDTGEIIGGKLDTRPSEVIQVLIENSLPADQSETFRNFDRLLKWADEIRTLGIRSNADTPNDARVARLFGAAGIGL